LGLLITQTITNLKDKTMMDKKMKDMKKAKPKAKMAMGGMAKDKPMYMSKGGMTKAKTKVAAKKKTK
jgi:hypothetical protein